MYFTNYFTQVFIFSIEIFPNLNNELSQLFSYCISDDENELFCSIPDIKEIKKCHNKVILVTLIDKVNYPS